MGPFRIKRLVSLTTVELDMPSDLLGGMRPVFHTEYLIPYETRYLDPEGMLPEDDADDVGDAFGTPTQPLEQPSSTVPRTPPQSSHTSPLAVDNSAGASTSPPVPIPCRRDSSLPFDEDKANMGNAHGDFVFNHVTLTCNRSPSPPRAHSFFTRFETFLTGI